MPTDADGSVTAAALDAVTLDAYGTLVELDRPVERLREALARRGVTRDASAVRAALDEEIAYYRDHKLEGRDKASLADLRRRCAEVFAAAAGCPQLDFADDFQSALAFAPLPGVREALARLRCLGLALAVVSDWDMSLATQLAATDLGPFDAVVAAAETGVEKPGTRSFERALEALGVTAGRALHVGDQASDEEGARAAGMHYLPAPLAAAVKGLA